MEKGSYCGADAVCLSAVSPRTKTGVFLSHLRLALSALLVLAMADKPIKAS